MAKRIIMMNFLPFLSWIYLDSMERGDLVSFVEKVVIQGEDARDDGEGVECPGFVEEGVDSVCVGAL